MGSAYMYSYNKIAKQYDACSGATMTHHVTLQTQHMYKLYMKNPLDRNFQGLKILQKI